MSGAHVFIDRSQFPENVRRDLLESLRARAINHKFHYESYKQTATWLALHEAFSPARTDPSCVCIYDEAFAAATSALNTERVQVVGLGCGGGQKEARLLQLLGEQKHELIYTPSDVSVPLVLTAREAALPFIASERCWAVVCDLGTIEDLDQTVGDPAPGAARLVTLFGIVPNFEPDPLLRQLARLLRAGDGLLLSANLAPGPDYATGVRTVLPQYDNELTRDWLMTLPLDLGFEREDGKLAFSIETDARRLHRITAHFELRHARALRVHGQTISFAAEERLRLFFSYRHTTAAMQSLLNEYGFEVRGHWLNDSDEEGVFLCRKRS